MLTATIMKQAILLQQGVDNANAERVLAASIGSDADVLSERHAALKFANKWLWENPGRRTVDREWPSDYLNDAVAMMVDYRRKQQNDEAEQPNKNS